MNSVRAGAVNITAIIDEQGGLLTFTVSDDGCGMTGEQVKKLAGPFFPTRKTRGVGLGVPFLKMLSEQTGGSLTVTSYSVNEFPEDHGTTLVATFHSDHIDFIPMGNIADTFITLIQGNPDINFTFIHRIGKEEVRLSCAELKSILGDVPLSNFEVLDWIRGYLAESYEKIK